MNFLSRQYHHVPYQSMRLWSGNDFQCMKCKYCNIRTFLQKVNSISPLKISHTMIYVHTFSRLHLSWFFRYETEKNEFLVEGREKIFIAFLNIPRKRLVRESEIIYNKLSIYTRSYRNVV